MLLSQGIDGALWDRLLRLPTNFFRRYSTGDLATRAAAAEDVRQMLGGSAVSAVLGAAFATGQHGDPARAFGLMPALLACGAILLLVGVIAVAGAAQKRLLAQAAGHRGAP